MNRVVNSYKSILLVLIRIDKTIIHKNINKSNWLSYALGLTRVGPRTVGLRFPVCSTTLFTASILTMFEKNMLFLAPREKVARSILSCPSGKRSANLTSEFVIHDILRLMYIHSETIWVNSG